MTTTTNASARFRKVALGPASVSVSRDDRGRYLLKSPAPLSPYPARLTERLVHWAAQAPERTLFAKRAASGDWRRRSSKLAEVSNMSPPLAKGNDEEFFHQLRYQDDGNVATKSCASNVARRRDVAAVRPPCRQ